MKFKKREEDKKFVQKVSVSKKTERLASKYVSLSKEAERSKFSVQLACTVKGKLHVPQYRCCLDPNKRIVGCLPRRSGKTTMEGIRAIDMCLNKPGAVVWYLAFTQSFASNTFINPVLRPMLKKFDIEYEIREGTDIYFPNGSVIQCMGIDDIHSIEKLRGKKPDLVFLDEVQSMREAILQPVVQDILGPALLDSNGVLIVTGTPSPTPAGYFYDITVGKLNKRWSKHHWTLYDNPTKTKIEIDDYLRKELLDTGRTEKDPSYIREWLGEWALEEDLRVYKYNPTLNNVAGEVSESTSSFGLKTRTTITRHPLLARSDSHLWRFAVGIDVGSGDRTAIVVLGKHYHDSHIFQVYEWVVYRRQEPVASDIAKIIAYIRTQYNNPLHWYFDSGGGGKMMMDTLNRDYGFNLLQGANKSDRRGQIDMINVMFRKHQLLVPAVSAAGEDCIKTIWDREKLKVGVYEYDNSVWHPDPMDALRMCAYGVYQHWHKDVDLAQLGSTERLRQYNMDEERAIDRELDDPYNNKGIKMGHITDDQHDPNDFGIGDDGW